jgi:hypothetical protein
VQPDRDLQKHAEVHFSPKGGDGGRLNLSVILGGSQLSQSLRAGAGVLHLKCIVLQFGTLRGSSSQNAAFERLSAVFSQTECVKFV